MHKHKEAAYTLLRITFGVMFLFFGIGKFAAGIGGFAGGMNQYFSGKLPSALVLPFSYALPFFEVILGLLILFGFLTTIALVASGLLLLALTFGTVILGDAPTVAHNLQYGLINFVLLWFVDFNRYSVDRLIRRTAKKGTAQTLVTLCCFLLMSGALVNCLAYPASNARHDAQGPIRFRLDPSQSKFVARAFSGGLLWFKGHDHFVAAREFSGEAEITPNAITPASLELRVKSESLVETRDVFTEQQKQIVNKELREIVLEPLKYPEIVFHSTNVAGKLVGNEYDLKIGGNLTLHGVTRQIVIPAKVTLTGNDLRGVGVFSIDRSNFGVKATSAFHGMVRVRDRINCSFDIVGHRI